MKISVKIMRFARNAVSVLVSIVFTCGICRAAVAQQPSLPMTDDTTQGDIEFVTTDQPGNALLGQWKLVSVTDSFFRYISMNPDNTVQFTDEKGSVVKKGKYFIRKKQRVIFEVPENEAEEMIDANLIYNHELYFLITQKQPIELSFFLHGQRRNGETLEVTWKFIRVQ